MKHTTLALLAAAALTAFATACGASAPATPAPTVAAPAATTPAPTPTATPSPTPVAFTSEIAALEDGEKYSYAPGTATVKAGEITLKLVNKGVKWPHTLVVRNPVGGADLFKSERVKLGDSADLKFTISEPGTYKIYCNVTGHEDKGMAGTLVVVKG